jgi:hypothetical protein
MATAPVLVAIAEAVSTASAVTKPVLAGRANARLLGPIELDIERSAVTGGGAIYGANLPHIAAGDTKYCVMPGSDGASTRTVFTTTLTYAAFSNYNFIVLKNGVVMSQGATASAVFYQVSDSSGVAVFTFGASLATTDVVEFFLVTPVLVYTHAAVQFKTIEKQGYDVLWYAADATTSPAVTNVYARPLGE